VGCISIGKQKVIWISKLREQHEEVVGNALRRTSGKNLRVILGTSSPRVKSIGCEPHLLKRRSQIRIPSLSSLVWICQKFKKKKKKKKSLEPHQTFFLQKKKNYFGEVI
jgi:hypothetical protein